jgi:hypothetical protein
MKTTSSTLTSSTPDFPGIVIDPTTSRKCALMIDITRGMGLAGSQIAATGARIYQNRYYDIEDVLVARSKVGKSGRGRPACNRRDPDL